MKENYIKYTSAVLLVLFSQICYSDLEALSDSNLSDVDGAGIGFVLEDFVLNGGEAVNGGGTFEISGLQTSDDEEVVIGISQLYIAGAGSYRGQDAEDNPVNIGRLINPFSLELLDGNDVGVSDKAVVEFSAPESGANGSRDSERPNMGIRFDLEIDGSYYQSLEGHVESLSIDGSYIRLWGGSDNESGSGRMEGELVLNIDTPFMEFFACDADGSNCGDTINFSDVSIQLELGSGDYQPVTFQVESSGQFSFEVASLEGSCASINDTGGCESGTDTGYDALSVYYDSGPAINIYIDDVSVGDTSFGSTTIDNLQIQYLKVSSHDL